MVPRELLEFAPLALAGSAIVLGTVRRGYHSVVGCSAAMILALTGCEPSCDTISLAPTYQIAVFDESSGDSICDADVFVNDDPATKSQERCIYWHTIPEGPSATIVVQRAEYVKGTKEVSTDYGSDECGHPIGRDIRVGLTRQP